MKRRNTTIRPLLLLGALALAGCAAAPNVGFDNVDFGYVLGPTSEKGLAIISLTRSGWTTLTSLSLHYRNPRDGSAGKIEMGGCCNIETGERVVPVVSYGHSRIPADVFLGELHVIELPPGDYEFFKYYGVGAQGPLRLSMTPGSPMSWKFKINAGRVVYLGNVNMEMRVDNRYRLTFADVRERDMRVLQRLYRGVPVDRVDMQLLAAPELQ